MNASEALRAARRRAGTSQRELARRAGVGPSAVAAYESGRRVPTAAQLDRLLAAVGLELGLEPRLPATCDHLGDHLRLSLTTRLHLALGGTGVTWDPSLSVWWHLLGLAEDVDVAVTGRAALGVWVPGFRAPAPLPCVVRSGRRAVLGTDSETMRCLWARAGRWPSGGLVAVPLSSTCRVLVPPPAELALDPSVATERLALRAAARLLHEQAALDEADRRVPALRDPDHAAEAEFVLTGRRLGGGGQAPAADSRSWRLADTASRDTWLRAHGYDA